MVKLEDKLPYFMDPKQTAESIQKINELIDLIKKLKGKAITEEHANKTINLYQQILKTKSGEEIPNELLQKRYKLILNPLKKNILRFNG